jgi:hypothetical protein
MGWAPHTIRGFLAGLAKKGIRVDVLERVRQVGPNKQGVKGVTRSIGWSARPKGKTVHPIIPPERLRSPDEVQD